MKKFLALALALAMVLSLAACGAKKEEAVAAAPKDEYPSKAVKIIIPFGAGGSTDMGGRVIAACLPQFLPGNYVVENQAGGSAIPGTVAVLNEKADGYTLGYNWYASFNFRPQFMQTNYTMDDFKMICGMTIQRNTLFIRPDDKRFSDVDSLVAYAKAHPGELNFSCGAANSWQLLITLGFLNAYGIADKVVEVPFTSANESSTQLLAGNIDFALLETATFTSALSAGTIKPICSFEGDRNTAAHKDCPTIGELGHPEVANVAENRLVICAPKDVPQDVCDKLSKACEQMCKDENFIILSEKCQQVIEFKTGDEVTKQLKDGMDTVNNLLKQAGMK